MGTSGRLRLCVTCRARCATCGRYQDGTVWTRRLALVSAVNGPVSSAGELKYLVRAGYGCHGALTAVRRMHSLSEEVGQELYLAPRVSLPLSCLHETPVLDSLY